MSNTPTLGTVCGKSYEARIAGPVSHGSDTRGRTRYIVQGVNHKNGTPIKFKSLEKAERHIKNIFRIV